MFDGGRHLMLDTTPGNVSLLEGLLVSPFFDISVACVIQIDRSASAVPLDHDSIAEV